MSVLNRALCASAGGNTGIPDCTLTLGILLGGFLVPTSFELTEEQMNSAESALAALRAAAINDLPSARIFPLPQIVGITDNSEDLVTETLGYGVTAPVREGNYMFTMRYTRGGNCMNNLLQKFNGGNWSWMGFDAAGNLIGTKVGTSMKGIPLDYFWADKFKFADGAAGTTFGYRLGFNPAYVNANLAFINIPLTDLLSIQGLKNIILSAIRAVAVLTAKATTGCGGVDLYDQYNAQLAVAANWTAKMAGKAVAITSVATNDALSAFTVTVSTADPNYVAGAPIVLGLAPVSILNAAGLKGFEGVPVSVPV